MANYPDQMLILTNIFSYQVLLLDQEIKLEDKVKKVKLSIIKKTIKTNKIIMETPSIYKNIIMVYSRIDYHCLDSP